MILSILVLCCTSFLLISGETTTSKCVFQINEVNNKRVTYISNFEEEMYSAKDDNGTYLYHIGICKTPNVSDKKLNQTFAAVIQQNLKIENAPWVVIGRYNDTDVKIGTNWGFLEFGSGDRYTQHCLLAQRVAMLMITCNEKISTPVLKIIEENNQKISSCYYLFELEHPKACNAVLKKDGSMSAGAIATIIIVTVVAIYFCIGTAVKKLFYNAQGVEIIPNITLWRFIGESFSNCVETICRPKPFNLDYDSYQPSQRGNLTINDLEPDDLDDDEFLVSP